MLEVTSFSRGTQRGGLGICLFFLHLVKCLANPVAGTLGPTWKLQLSCNGVVVIHSVLRAYT